MPSQIQYLVLGCDETLTIQDRDNLPKLVEELKGIAELVPLSEIERKMGISPRIRIDSRKIDELDYRNTIERLHEIGYQCIGSQLGENTPKFLPSQPWKSGSTEEDLRVRKAYYKNIQGHKPLERLC